MIVGRAVACFGRVWGRSGITIAFALALLTACASPPGQSLLPPKSARPAPKTAPAPPPEQKSADAAEAVKGWIGDAASGVGGLVGGLLGEATAPAGESRPAPTPGAPTAGSATPARVPVPATSPGGAGSWIGSTLPIGGGPSGAPGGLPGVAGGAVPAPSGETGLPGTAGAPGAGIGLPGMTGGAPTETGLPGVASGAMPAGGVGLPEDYVPVTPGLAKQAASLARQWKADARLMEITASHIDRDPTAALRNPGAPREIAPIASFVFVSPSQPGAGYTVYADRAGKLNGSPFGSSQATAPLPETFVALSRALALARQQGFRDTLYNASLKSLGSSVSWHFRGASGAADGKDLVIDARGGDAPTRPERANSRGRPPSP